METFGFVLIGIVVWLYLGGMLLVRRLIKGFEIDTNGIIPKGEKIMYMASWPLIVLTMLTPTE